MLLKNKNNWNNLSKIMDNNKSYKYYLLKNKGNIHNRMKNKENIQNKIWYN